jgi:uncharacterized membrane protein YhdT
MTFSQANPTAQLSFTASSTGPFTITYDFSNPPSPDYLWYTVPNPQTVTVSLRTLSIYPASFAAVAPGVVSPVYTITSNFVPVSGLQVNFTDVSNVGIQFFPQSVFLTPSQPSAPFQFASSVSGPISFVLSGGDEDLYQAPASSKISVNPLSIQAPIWQAMYCGDTVEYPFSISSLPSEYVSVALFANGATFEPSSFNFSSDDSDDTVNVQVTAIYSNPTTQVTYVVTGPDSDLVQNLNNNNFNIRSKTITAPTYNGGLTVGVPTSFVISLNMPPASDLTVTPIAPGVVFSPASFEFNTSTLLTVSFTATPSNVGRVVVTYYVTGTDAGCYTPPPSTNMQINALSAAVSPYFVAFSLPIGIQSNPYTFTVPALQNDVTVTPYGYGLTFTPASFTLTPAIPSAYFTLVGSVIGVQVAQFSVSGDGATSIGNLPLINATVNVLQRTFTLPSSLSNVYVQVPSDPIIVALAYAPINGVSLRLWAPNTVFTPETLEFTSTELSQSFTYVTSAAGLNQQVTFFVTGDDAALYQVPATLTLNAYLRPLIVSQPAAATYNTKFYFTISTLYSPPNSLTFTPVGAFTFSSPMQTITSDGAGSVSFSATPLGIGNAPIKVIVGGDSALYSVIADLQIQTEQASFIIALPQTLDMVLGVPSVPVYVYCSAPPANDVSITITSSQLVISPSVLTFTPSSTVAQITALADASYFAANGGGSVTFTYTVGGSDAAYFAGASQQIQVSVQSPIRNLELSPAEIAVVPGTLTYFTITLEDLPLNSVTVTPNVDNAPFITITPANAVFTSTSAQSAIFSISTTFPLLVTAQIDVTVTGPDAYFYQASAQAIDTAVTSPMGVITTNLPQAPIQAQQTTTVEFMDISVLAPQSDLMVTPFVANGPAVTFSPSTLTFTPTTLSLRYTITPSAPGVVIVGFNVSGDDAAFFYLQTQTDALNVVGLNIYGLSAVLFNGNDQLVAGVTSRTFTANVDVLPPNGITVTPFSPELTFTPSDLVFTPQTGAVTFTVTPNVNAVSRQSTVQVAFALTGTDAALYTTPASFTTSILPRTLTLGTVPTLFGFQSAQIAITAQYPPINGLTVSFSGSGITFTPAEVTISNGTSSSFVTITPSQSGITNARISVSLGGDDAGLYTTPSIAPLTVQWGQINIPPTANGIYSVTVPITLTPAPQGTVVVTPVSEGVTFTPASLVFGPSITALSFTAVSSVPGPAQFTYTLSGDYASSYRFAGGATQATATNFQTLMLDVSTPTAAYTYVAGSVSRPFVITSQTMDGTSTVAPNEPVIIVPFANFDDAVFYPANVSIEAPANTATFSVSTNTIGTLVVGFTVYTNGSSYAAMSSVTLPVSQRSFDIAANLFQNTAYSPASSVFVFNVTSPQFTIFAKSVPANVTLTPVSENFKFTPETLNFDSATSAANFTITGTAVGPAIISFVVGGPDAALFSVPAPHTYTRVTYQIGLPVVPALSVGVPSEPQRVTIYPVPVEPFILYLPAATAKIVYTPTQLVFAAGTNASTFTALAYATTITTDTEANIPGTQQTFTAAPNAIILAGRENGDFQTYAIPLSTPTSVNVMPGIFVLHHPRYQMNVQSHVDVEISVAPRSDIVITLYGNNLVFEPAHVTFRAGQSLKQSVEVTPLGATSYETDDQGFKVNYICSGTNSQDYLCPSETIHYIALPRWYIAAAVLAPIGFVIICIIVAFVIYRRRNTEKVRRLSVGSVYESLPEAPPQAARGVIVADQNTYLLSNQQ